MMAFHGIVRGMMVVLLLADAARCGGASFVTGPPPPPPSNQQQRHWSVDWVALFRRGAMEVGLNATSPTILAALSARLHDAEIGRAAVRNLAATASDTKPDWKATDKVWDAPNWTAWDLTSTAFHQPARFSGCTDYGLLGLFLLQRGNFTELQSAWSVEEAARYKHMHQALCYVWFAGAWNQGTWAGLGTTLMSQTYPDTAEETTPWMYPYLTRKQHSEKVYRDFFDQQVMMEDADGYNMIWCPMMLVWPELVGREQQLLSPGVTQILSNFRDYIAPDGQMFQFASGLSSHYTGIEWVATFERAASLTGDGSFRFAAKQMWEAFSRQNMTSARSLVTGGRGNSAGPGTFWAPAYGLLCGRYSLAQVGSACGPGWANTSIPLVDPPGHRQPSSVVHRRREVGALQMPDKIVMAHSKEYRSTKTFITLEAHTGRSLWHSHAVMTTAITNLWQGGARYLGSPGKHDQSASDANHIVMVRGRRSKSDGNTTQPPPGFPQRNASDMFTPGDWSTLMLPVHEHLPMLDASGPGYLKRNFSALGFSCDNWQNETITLTILPISLRGPNGVSLPIDDFSSGKTAALWTLALPVSSAISSVIQEPTSPSGYALQLVCAANTTSCGPPDPRTGSCPTGCIFDSGWCQAVQTSFVNRQASEAYPLPTEVDPFNTIDVRTFESFDLAWKVSANYKPPPAGSSAFPIGVQTMDYPTGCFCNKTLVFCGNAVRSTLKPPNSASAPLAIQVKAHPHAETLADGEFWPIVTHADAAVHGNDLYSEISVDRGYFTSGTRTDRQVLALAEGPVLVLDSLTPDQYAHGWVGGPSWMVVTGVDSSALHYNRWPQAWQRPNVTARGQYWADFYGFADVFDVGGQASPPVALTSQHFLVAFPPLTNDPVAGLKVMGLTDSTVDSKMCQGMLFSFVSEHRQNSCCCTQKMHLSPAHPF
jgi:hypothetical protein